MIAAQPFQGYDDNPCRPRHFKPPPCAPVVPEGPARKALEACRARLFFTGILFACVFGVVALRVVEVVLLEGGTAQSHMPRFRIPPPPAPARADIVDRNGRLLATTLDSPSVYANPKQILDPADATLAVPGIGDQRGAVPPDRMIDRDIGVGDLSRPRHGRDKPAGFRHL